MGVYLGIDHHDCVGGAVVAQTHRIKKVRADWYELSWPNDFRFGKQGTMRNKTRNQRTTDRKGAERFAKKHGLRMPK